jgi:glutathione S-transferase
MMWGSGEGSSCVEAYRGGIGADKPFSCLFSLYPADASLYLLINALFSPSPYLVMEFAAPSFFDFNVFGWPFSGLVTLFALAIYFMFALKVATARIKYKVPPPATDGPPEFLRILRVQANTLEQIVIFLPLLWMAAFATHDAMAALIGIFWPVSRLVYAAGYYKDAKKRLPGFIFGTGVLFLLFLIVGVQLVRSAFFWDDPAGIQAPL